MRGHHHRAPAGRHLAQHVIQHHAGILVQAGVRLIKKHHFRVVQHGPADGQALLHAARKGAHQVAPPRRQADHLQHLSHTLVQARHAIHPPVEVQVFLGGQVAIEQRLVRDHTQDAPHGCGLSRQAVTGNAHLTQGRAGKRSQDTQKGGLTGAVRAQQGDKLALLELQNPGRAGRS